VLKASTAKLQMKRFSFAATLAVLVMGCASTPDRSQAIALAEQEVRQRGWQNYEISNVRRSDGGWRISLNYLPATPGGHADVIVKNGKVVAYYPGK
jgi:hypothetical protein